MQSEEYKVGWNNPIVILQKNLTIHFLYVAFRHWPEITYVLHRLWLNFSVVDMISIQEKYKNIPRGSRVSLVSFLIVMTKYLIQGTRKGGGREGRSKERMERKVEECR